MLIQISAGQGPAECSLAVQKQSEALKEEFGEAKIITKNEDYSGNGYKSCVMELTKNASELEGFVLWICKSPIRPEHKRKNWFIDVSVLPEPQEEAVFSKSDVVIETVNCRRNGGQNVNKIESGIIIRHIPTGIVVECTEERSQFMNKQKALRRLQAVLDTMNSASKASLVNEARQKHYEPVRDNRVRIYEGIKFVRKQNF